MRMHYSREVTVFLRSLGEEGSALRRAIESLKQNPVPEWTIPIPDRPSGHEWFVEGYWVLFEVDRSNPSETIIWIVVIKPN